MANIYVTLEEGVIRDTFMPDDVTARIHTLGTARFNALGRPHTSEELAELVKGVDILITGWHCPYLSQDVIDNAGQLKLIAHCGGSVANHVGPEVYSACIRVTGGNYVFAQSVAEGTIAYMLLGLRNILYHSNRLQKEGWRDSIGKSEGLLDQKVGLIGLGAVARNLVPMLQAFGCEVMAYDPFVPDEVFDSLKIKKATLQEVASQNRVVSLHVSQYPGSNHLVSREIFKLMKDGTLFVNTARGHIVDEDALTDELVSGRISAVLDVFKEEPLPMDSKLRHLDNAVLIPHMGGPTIDRRRYVSHATIDDVVRFQKGEPLQYEIDSQYAMRMTKEVPSKTKA